MMHGADAADDYHNRQQYQYIFGCVKHILQKVIHPPAPFHNISIIYYNIPARVLQERLPGIEFDRFEECEYNIDS